ncbi:antA/AntB antirepressor family protein [Ilyobacter polytropus]|uniref:AntA/AntB antirepressor domain protein n=1 Tax=Ilyobacter polytropus (strain ATCC 51220 / DSM 2926 / LMG 16218 / CuHBu1) TaxID=572544 RepID=E3HBN1_ILYPC|nr:antA/AntB antirepressor family protein [Ilyobacter polytropus]ADO83727.1 AntA/AntB antirepressor domain protein [Ilyobacter polytropus DSM 2926]
MLVKVKKDKYGNSLVSARELHEFLEVKRVFTSWIKERIEKYKFEENLDFTTLWNDTKSGVVVKFNGNKHSMVQKGYKLDYIITLNMAKELSMIENNEKGRQARKYFIQCEEQYYKVIESINNIEFNPRLREIKERVDNIKNLEEQLRDLQERIKAEYTILSTHALRMADIIDTESTQSILTSKKFGSN